MADFSSFLGTCRNDPAENVAHSPAAKVLLGELFSAESVSVRTVTSRAEDFGTFAVRARGLTWERSARFAHPLTAERSTANPSSGVSETSEATPEEDFFVVTPRTTDSELARERAKGTAPNSCVYCKHEKTCGYSFLATVGERHVEFSYGPCVLGRRSNGKLFFEARAVNGGAQATADQPGAKHAD